MPSNFIKDLVDHKQRVAGYMQKVAAFLFGRAAVHDNSKFGPEEFALYDAAFSDLQKYAYGSEELKAVYKQIEPALTHHVTSNDHHPEYFTGHVGQMDLMQVTEMVCDWLAASERSQTPLTKGLEINRVRYDISDQLFEIICNTARELAPEKFLVKEEQ